MEQSDLTELGITKTVEEQVLSLAGLAKSSGMDGVVCSAHEVVSLKANMGQDFVLVTPGIRLSHAIADDQRRIMTPQEALSAGSDYLVMGRPITQAQDPIAILQDVNHVAMQLATGA
jgi:orotidine-5'-phosphate decarboxylase